MLKGNDAHTICHFVGAAPGSTDLRFMLVRLCTLLQPHYVEGLFPPRVPEGLQEVQVRCEQDETWRPLGDDANTVTATIPFCDGNAAEVESRCGD